MKLLIAVDSAPSAEVLVRAVMMQPWPAGTTVNVLSVVVDAEVPDEVCGVKKAMELAPCDGR